MWRDRVEDSDCPPDHGPDVETEITVAHSEVVYSREEGKGLRAGWKSEVGMKNVECGMTKA